MSNDFIDALPPPRRSHAGDNPNWSAWLIVVGLILFAIAAWLMYHLFLIEVPRGHVAVLIKKTGLELEKGEVAAPTEDHKGIQRELLTEGRHFRNPYTYQWRVVRQVEIPEGKLGVRIRMYGTELPPGEFIVQTSEQKGIVHDILAPGGRYPINPLLEEVEIHDPVTIPAGYKGVLTLLAGPIAEESKFNDAKHLLVPDGYRGVQKTSLEPSTYYVNPYIRRIDVVDCRSQKHTLAEEKDFGFHSKDGFWVSLDGTIEYRIQPDRVAEVFVLYNESVSGDILDKAIIRKVILPNARSFCRLEGSKNLGRELMQGETREKFQQKFKNAIKTACAETGIEIVEALINDIRPPEQIAEPVRRREFAKQLRQQYDQEILQQESEAKLAIEKQLVLQKTVLVQAEQEVIQMTTEAKRLQDVSVTKANENKSVAQFKLEAAKDEAAAILSRGKAEADVVALKNEAEAAGWRKAVAAFNGSGAQFAQYALFQKMSPAYRQIMVNTADSPIMRIFESFASPKEKNGDETKDKK